MPFGSTTTGKSTSSTITTIPCAFQNMHTITDYYTFWTRTSNMTNEKTYRYCEHKNYGVGSAQLTRYRKGGDNDLFMVTFQSIGLKSKYWFCRKHFMLGDEIEFISEARATELFKEGRKDKKQKRTKSVRKEPKNFGDLLDSLF